MVTNCHNWLDTQSVTSDMQLGTLHGSLHHQCVKVCVKVCVTVRQNIVKPFKVFSRPEKCHKNAAHLPLWLRSGHKTHYNFDLGCFPRSTKWQKAWQCRPLVDKPGKTTATASTGFYSPFVFQHNQTGVKNNCKLCKGLSAAVFMQKVNSDQFVMKVSLYFYESTCHIQTRTPSITPCSEDSFLVSTSSTTPM